MRLPCSVDCGRHVLEVLGEGRDAVGDGDARARNGRHAYAGEGAVSAAPEAVHGRLVPGEGALARRKRRPVAAPVPPQEALVRERRADLPHDDDRWNLALRRHFVSQQGVLLMLPDSMQRRSPPAQSQYQMRPSQTFCLNPFDRNQDSMAVLGAVVAAVEYRPTVVGSQHHLEWVEQSCSSHSQTLSSIVPALSASGAE